MYISDETGRSFSTSLDNVIKGSAVDFERVTSLDGTFIANKYVPSKNDADRRNSGLSRQGFYGDIQEEFDESDMIEEETKKMRTNRMGNMNNQNKRQKETEDEVFKLQEGTPAFEVQNNVRTFITHNKGGKWELIKAPEVSGRKKGMQTACYVEDGCSLHLEIYSHMGELAPVYSTEKAIGLVLGTGNIGTRLTDNDSQKSLFLSRDGGLTWRTIRTGVHIYEIGDHGALIVTAQKNTPTNKIFFSWDEGDTWDTLTISEHNIFVENIIIEPNSISQQFMVYGTYAEASFDEDEDPMMDDISIEKGNSAYLVYLDFS